MDEAEKNDDKEFLLSNEVRERLISMIPEGRTTTPEECLRVAALLIGQARSQFDDSYTTCEHCELKHYNNYGDHLVYNQLKGFMKKARRVADEAERKRQTDG